MGVGTAAISPVTKNVRAITSTGAAAAAKIGETIGGLSSSFKKLFSKTAKSKFAKEEIIFAINLASYASHIDGTLDDLERELISEELASCVEKEYISQAEIEYVLDTPPSFKKIKELYGAIKTKHIQAYQELLDDIHNADYHLKDEEKILKYKCNLLFKEYEDIPVFKVIDDKVGCPTGKIQELVNYIGQDEAKNTYNLTDFDYETIYVLHPGNNELLIPASTLLEPDFIYDRETEILEAMRIAGATKVRIHQHKKYGGSISAKGSAEANVNAVEVIKAGAGSSANLSLSGELSKNECIEVTYSAKKSWNSLFSQKSNFLKKSKWLKKDSKLAWLLEARSKANPPKTYSYKISYHSIISSVFCASLMAELDLVSNKSFKAKNSIEAELQAKLNIERTFDAEFI